MEKLKTTHMILASVSRQEKINSECVHCGTEYLKKTTHKEGSPYCPTCGGLATTGLGYPKLEIAMTTDYFWNEKFKLERAQEKRFGDFWRTVQRETSKATN
jgi:hypothetical protein